MADNYNDNTTQSSGFEKTAAKLSGLAAGGAALGYGLNKWTNIIKDFFNSIRFNYDIGTASIYGEKVRNWLNPEKLNDAIKEAGINLTDAIKNQNLAAQQYGQYGKLYGQGLNTLTYFGSDTSSSFTDKLLNAKKMMDSAKDNYDTAKQGVTAATQQKETLTAIQRYINSMESAWYKFYNNNPTLVSIGIGILGVFAAWLLYKVGRKMWSLFKDWLKNRNNIDDSQINEQEGMKIVQESDESAYENIQSSGWGKASLGAGLAGAGAYGLTKLGDYSNQIDYNAWVSKSGPGGEYWSQTDVKGILYEFLENHKDLKPYLQPILDNPGKVAFATIGTVLAGYGLYRALKAWREHLQAKKIENPELASEIPANA